MNETEKGALGGLIDTLFSKIDLNSDGKMEPDDICATAIHLDCSADTFVNVLFNGYDSIQR